MCVFFFRNHNTEQNHKVRIKNNVVGILRAEGNSSTDVSQCSSSQHQKQATREKATKRLQQTEQKVVRSKRQMLVTLLN
jgi:hypothetical protein